MAKAEKNNPLLSLLALLHAQADLYHVLHWNVRTPAGIALHKLFDELYEAAGSDLDALAEQILVDEPYTGKVLSPINGTALVTQSLVCLKHWDEPDAMLEQAHESERDCLRVIEEAYNTLKEAGKLPLGIDDLLMSMHREHRHHIYLLNLQCPPLRPL
jgi:DNA-binding ferritin-like protein